MSVSMLCHLDMVVVFGRYCCVVIMEASHSKVFEGFRRGVLCIVDFSTGPQPAVCLLAKASEGWLWHRGLGHAGMRNLNTLAKKKHVIGIENVKFLKDHLCGACEAGKMTKAKHPAKTVMTTTRPFELLHMDLFGPNHYSAVSNDVWLPRFNRTLIMHANVYDQDQGLTGRYHNTTLDTKWNNTSFILQARGLEGSNT